MWKTKQNEFEPWIRHLFQNQAAGFSTCEPLRNHVKFLRTLVVRAQAGTRHVWTYVGKSTYVGGGWEQMNFHWQPAAVSSVEICANEGNVICRLPYFLSLSKSEIPTCTGGCPRAQTSCFNCTNIQTLASESCKWPETILFKDTPSAFLTQWIVFGCLPLLFQKAIWPHSSLTSFYKYLKCCSNTGVLREARSYVKLL